MQDGEDHVRRQIAEGRDQATIDLDHRHVVTAAVESACHAGGG